MKEKCKYAETLAFSLLLILGKLGKGKSSTLMLRLPNAGFPDGEMMPSADSFSNDLTDNFTNVESTNNGNTNDNDNQRHENVESPLY